MNNVKDAYSEGVCPDCGETIDDDVVEGGECKNCGHVFWSNNFTDDDFNEQIKYVIDLPSYNCDGEWTQVAEFDTKKEALIFAKEKFGADSKGRINLITEVR